MANTYFQFKTFIIEQQHCAMKVTTDACLFGAWVADQISKEKNILDIGSGTGLLSLMLAHKNASLIITSVEIEENCYQQLTENISKSIFAQQITPVLGNILNFDAPHLFNHIITNPPFYENQLKSGNQEINKARHDDSLSLKDLFKTVEKLLEPHGVFYLLMPYSRKEETIKIAQEAGFGIARLTTVRQTSAHSPFRMMFRLEKNKQHVEEDEITIKESNGNYTITFVKLLKEYYLNL